MNPEGGEARPLFFFNLPLALTQESSAGRPRRRNNASTLSSFCLSFLPRLALSAPARKEQRKERRVASRPVASLHPYSRRVHPIRVSPNARATRVDRRAKKVSQWVGRPTMAEKSSDLRRTCDATRALTFFVGATDHRKISRSLKRYLTMVVSVHPVHARSIIKIYSTILVAQAQKEAEN